METIQQQLGLDDKSYAKLKLFNRILISYNDFKQVYEITSLLIEENLYNEYPRENRELVIALNMAAIVAYARPFLDTRGELAHNRLPGKILRILSTEEKELHDTVLEDRHTMMAHSDADANVTIPLVLDTGGRSLVIPKNASASYETTLTAEAMKMLQGMSLKLQERCFGLRQELEPEMLLILPRTQVEQFCDD